MVAIAGIVENCLISGVATEVAIVSGEAPGSCAETEIAGKSTSAAPRPAGSGRRRGRRSVSASEAGSSRPGGG